MNKNLRTVCRAAIIAALYVVLTFAVKPLAFGPLQFRISEALVVLPALMPGAIPGLALGCLLANVMGGLGWIDIILGTLATLLASWLTEMIAKRSGIHPEMSGRLSRYSLWRRKALWLIPLPAVILNALIVGVYLPLLQPTGDPLWIAFPVSMGQLAFSEAVVVYLFGIPFFMGLHPYAASHRQIFA